MRTRDLRVIGHRTIFTCNDSEDVARSPESARRRASIFTRRDDVKPSAV